MHKPISLLSNKIIKEFSLNIINPEVSVTNREIRGAAINRAGLELKGEKNNYQKSHIIGWGSKESQWLEKIGDKKAKKTLNNIFSNVTPLILLSSGVTDNIVKLIVEQANKYEIPVCLTGDNLSASTITLGSYLSSVFAPSISIQGSLVNVNGVGIIIIGKSGIGKSEAVLELIQNNHFFISDDTVVLKRVGKQFIGWPADITRDLLEARGIGFIDIQLIYGKKVVKESSQVDLVVELIMQDEMTEFDRLGNAMLRYEILNSSIPKIQIPVNKGRSMSVLIEAAANVFLAKKSGNDPLEKVKSQRGGK